MHFFQRPNHASIAVGAPLGIVWNTLTDPATWTEASSQIVAIRRSREGLLQQGECFEIDSQYEPEDPIVASHTEVLEIVPKKRLRLGWHKIAKPSRVSELLFCLADELENVKITVNVTPASVRSRVVLLLFCLNDATLIRDTFLRVIKTVSQRHATHT